MARAGFDLGEFEPNARFGAGRIHELGEELERLGARRPLVLCSWRRHRSESFGHVAGGLGFTPRIFDRVEEHVPRQLVDAAWDATRDAEADSVVSYGGGSAVDLGKAVVERAARAGRAVVHVAVVTTYAGAEATHRFWVSEGQDKRAVSGNHLRPEGVILDPSLTLELPWKPTASTGMTAVAHATEALLAPHLDERLRQAAGRSLPILISRLPQAVADPGQPSPRADLLEGSFLAGVAVDRIEIGVREALAASLGGRAGVAHGVATAILLPHVLRRRLASGERSEALVGAMGQLEEDIPAALDALVRRLGLPRRLREVGVFEEDLATVASRVAGDRTGSTGESWESSPAELAALLRRAW